MSFDNIKITRSLDGINRLKHYLAKYCSISERIKSSVEFIEDNKETFPATQFYILDLLADNARICLDQGLLEDAQRHAKDLERKINSL